MYTQYTHTCQITKATQDLELEIHKVFPPMYICMQKKECHCVCTHVETRGQPWGSFSKNTSHFLWDKVSCSGTNQLVRRVWGCPMNPRDPPISTLPVPGLALCNNMGTQGLLACEVGTLSMKLFPQPSFAFQMILIWRYFFNKSYWT